MNIVSSPILPPAMLGILGGGQLGSMFTIAAKTMGYRVTVLDPDPNAPAAQFADRHLCASFNDAEALHELAQCAAITTEFENVCAQAMQQLAQHTRVSPSGECVAIAQNRITEKTAVRACGLNTVSYQIIEKEEDINKINNALLPGILKTAKLGYDGKGQIPVQTIAEVYEAFTALGKVNCVLEQRVDLRAEISVIVCRLDNDSIKVFDAAENIHKNGILAYSLLPARLPDIVLKQAQQMAIHLAQSLNYVGVLAVEFFVVGDDMRLMINEIAPRPHNSGHHTIDACISSQFQQQVRIMCGLAPMKTDLLIPCCMVNILGDIWGEKGQEPRWDILLKCDNVHVHQYGKQQARPGRKMGHFTVLAETVDDAFITAQMLHCDLNQNVL